MSERCPRCARLTKDFTFEAAQTLPNAPEGHKCRGVHGHSFKVEVSVEGEVDPKIGWVYDHAKISDAMKPLLKMLDHSYFNDIEGLENPTIEEYGGVVLEETGVSMPGSLRDRRARNTDRALHLSGRIRNRNETLVSNSSAPVNSQPRFGLRLCHSVACS